MKPQQTWDKEPWEAGAPRETKLKPQGARSVSISHPPASHKRCLENVPWTGKQQTRSPDPQTRLSSLLRNQIMPGRNFLSLPRPLPNHGTRSPRLQFFERDSTGLRGPRQTLPAPLGAEAQVWLHPTGKGQPVSQTSPAQAQAAPAGPSRTDRRAEPRARTRSTALYSSPPKPRCAPNTVPSPL